MHHISAKIFSATATTDEIAQDIKKGVSDYGGELYKPIRFNETEVFTTFRYAMEYIADEDCIEYYLNIGTRFIDRDGSVKWVVKYEFKTTSDYEQMTF